MKTGVGQFVPGGRMMINCCLVMIGWGPKPRLCQTLPRIFEVSVGFSVASIWKVQCFYLQVFSLSSHVQSGTEMSFDLKSLSCFKIVLNVSLE